MKPILLDLVYAAGLLGASPYFLYKMATTGKYRAGLSQKLGLVPERSGAPCIWLHGVSVGELLSARPLVGALSRELPGEEIVLSATTDTGMDAAERSFPERERFYYPLDFSWAVKRTFRRIRPRLVILMELEVWPNFLERARREGVPVIVANGRITERSRRNFERFGRYGRRLLEKVTLFLVQSGVYAERLRSLGVPAERVRVAGNLKYDSLSTDLNDERRRRLREEMGVREAETLIVVGSTHAGEEEALLEAFAELRERHEGLRLLVVPRHRTRFEEAARVITARGFSLRRRSEGPRAGPGAADEVVLGDRMGELADLYEAGEVAFVGGSLIPHGGQNMLEPAARGKPVVFGPSVENFPDAAPLLLEAGAATMIRGREELAGALESYLDAAAAERAGEAGRQAVLSARGATEETVAAVREVLKNMDER